MIKVMRFDLLTKIPIAVENYCEMYRVVGHLAI